MLKKTMTMSIYWSPYREINEKNHTLNHTLNTLSRWRNCYHIILMLWRPLLAQHATCMSDYSVYQSIQ